MAKGMLKCWVWCGLVCHTPGDSGDLPGVVQGSKQEWSFQRELAQTSPLPGAGLRKSNEVKEIKRLFAVKFNKTFFYFFPRLPPELFFKTPGIGKWIQSNSGWIQLVCNKIGGFFLFCFVTFNLCFSHCLSEEGIGTGKDRKWNKWGISEYSTQLECNCLI